MRRPYRNPGSHPIEKWQVAFNKYYRQLGARQLPGDGFAARAGAGSRADTTAWGILALRKFREAQAVLEPARQVLAALQLDDGRVPVVAGNPDAIWPTPLAVMAWYGAPKFRGCRERAIEFILSHTGTYPPRTADNPGRHDTVPRGWPWNLETYSWVTPTALCVLALQLTGNDRQGRVMEAVKMLKGRRVPEGGWNYGSTVVYGTDLLPLPETTGVALDTLRGHVSRDWASSSLAYLQRAVSRIRTPISVGWGLLGLSAWNARPPEGDDWIRQTLARQQTLGAFATDQLALLLVAAQARHGLLSIFSGEKNSEFPSGA